MRFRPFFIVPLLAAWAAPVLLAAAPTPNSTEPAAGLYDTIVAQYMGGQWDELEQTMATRARELNRLTVAQKQDVTYIRQSMAETRPAWWKPVKSAIAPSPIRAMVWGRPLDMTYDPAGKGGVQVRQTDGRTELTVSWPAADMDNTAHAEHGFTKGELNNLSIFGTLGMAGMWAELPMASLINLSEDQKALLSRGFDFTGNITGIYHGSPRARQWGLWLYLHSYLAKYEKMQTINARKAVAAAFMIEVLSNPKKYPSIELPAQLDADKAEEKLALAMHTKIEKKGWTLAEDMAIRQAIRTFALANPAVLKQGGMVTLPAGLAIHLDPAQDTPLRAKRDAWFKKQFDKVKPAK